jgi:hypothetical protein
MQEVYRKRSRSNVLLDSSEFTAGRIVWVSVNGGTRQERVCTGNGTEIVTQAEFKERREKRAAENRAHHRVSSWSRRSSTRREWGHGLGLAW